MHAMGGVWSRVGPGKERIWSGQGFSHRTVTYSSLFCANEITWEQS